MTQKYHNIPTIASVENRLTAPVTIFESVNTTNPALACWTLQQLFEHQTTDDEIKGLTDILRQIKAKDKDYYKAKRKEVLSLFVIGYWPKRGELATPVNLLIFDIDGGNESGYPRLFSLANNCPFIYRVEQSLGGGARVYVWADFGKNRKPAYMAIAEKLGQTFSIPLKNQTKEIDGEHIDTATFDAGRMWFPAHTPPELVYHNEESEVFVFEQPAPSREKKEDNSGGGAATGYKYEFSEDEKVNNCVQQIEQRRLDITGTVTDEWFTKVLLPFATWRGEAGREYARRVSVVGHSYDQSSFDYQYGLALAKERKDITIGSFLEHCKDHGITYNAQQIIEEQKRQAGQATPVLEEGKAEAKEEGREDESIEEEKAAKAADQIKLEEFLARKFQFRFNEITRMPEYRLKAKKTPWERMDDYRLNSIVRLAKLAGLKAAAKSRIAETIESDFARMANPIQEYFLELETKKDRDYIGDLVNTVITVSSPDLFRKYFEKWLVGAVANVFVMDRCANHQCLVLTGGQGAYKSTWIKNLCPPGLLDYYVERNLNPDNKDDLFATAATLLYNMDDFFADCSAKKVNQFKGFITQNTVNARPPYGRYAINLPKICSFVGSSNEAQFLHDSTGSRRFLPFEVKSIDIDAAQKIDMGLVWAQAYNQYLDGFQYWLSKEDQTELQDHNEQYQVQSIEYELLISYFHKPTNEEEATHFLSTTQILEKILTRSPLNRLSKKKLGMELKRAGFEQNQRRINGNPTWGYLVVERPDYDRADDISTKTTEGGEDWLKN